MSDHLLAILSYHKLGPPGPEAWDTWYYVREASFVEHLEHLTSEGWQFLDLTDFLDGLKSPANLPERAALLTFDDGYSSVARVALPRLVEFGIPGVMFVPTAYIGATNEFDLDTHEPQEPICSWNELELLEQHGVAVQSHGETHRGFSDMSIGEIEQELVRVQGDTRGSPRAGQSTFSPFRMVMGALTATS